MPLLSRLNRRNSWSPWTGLHRYSSTLLYLYVCLAIPCLVSAIVPAQGGRAANGSSWELCIFPCVSYLLWLVALHSHTSTSLARGRWKQAWVLEVLVKTLAAMQSHPRSCCPPFLLQNRARGGTSQKRVFSLTSPVNLMEKTTTRTNTDLEYKEQPHPLNPFST